MTKLSGLVEARNEVLWKIGRNVVNFQKIEGMLKFLNANCRISGPISDFENIRKKISGSVSRQPMGRLADTFVRSVYSSQPESKDVTDSNEEVHLSLSFSVEDGQKLVKERKAALSEVVAQRNNLIHKWLVKFDPNSIESCKELSAKLDAQREALIPEYEILRSMVMTLKDFVTDLREYSESTDFIVDLKKAKTDA